MDAITDYNNFSLTMGGGNTYSYSEYAAWVSANTSHTDPRLFVYVAQNASDANDVRVILTTQAGQNDALAEFAEAHGGISTITNPSLSGFGVGTRTDTDNYAALLGAGSQDGNDTVDGGAGDDNITGGDGNDSILGGSGADTLSGGDGSDTLEGGAGADSIDGGAGDDNIVASQGDTVTGGAGDDVFSFDPSVTDLGAITVTGGETDEEATVDPTNNPNGRIGDVLDLRGLDNVVVTYDDNDPEAGTVTYTNDNGTLVTVNFNKSNAS